MQASSRALGLSPETELFGQGSLRFWKDDGVSLTVIDLLRAGWHANGNSVLGVGGMRAAETTMLDVQLFCGEEIGSLGVERPNLHVGFSGRDVHNLSVPNQNLPSDAFAGYGDGGTKRLVWCAFVTEQVSGTPPCVAVPTCWVREACDRKSR